MDSKIIIDEAEGYFQTEPTPAETMERIRYWEPSSETNTKAIGIEVDPEAVRRWERLNAKYKRQREQAKCLHGMRYYEINYAPGVRPA